MRRVSHYEHVFRAGRGEPVERVPHPEHPDPGELALAPAVGPADRDAGLEAYAQLSELRSLREPVTIATDLDGAAADSPTTGVDAGVDAGGDTAAEQPIERPAGAPADDPAPLRLEFSSSNIRIATLDPATGILEVTFNSGKSYRYANFTVERMVEWRAVRDAGRSAGSWFNANVKNRPDAHPLIVSTSPAGDGK